MARVVRSGRRAVTDPLKLSQPLGAALAFLGLDRCMPLVHGSQGCAAFAKAFLTRHFREPVPLQTTAVTELTAVLGGGDHLTAALDTVRATAAPDVIGVLTTGVSEASGEDVAATVRGYLADRAGEPPPTVILVSTPDFVGGLSDGWAAALGGIVRAGLALPPRAERVPDWTAEPERPAFPVLAGVSLTAADLDELEALVAGFGLTPLLVPDLSRSLDGHLARAWSPLTTGGTARSALAGLRDAAAAAAVGATTGRGADALRDAGVPVIRTDHLGGLAAVDAFVDRLRTTTSAPVPERVLRDRARLTDGLLDTHFVLGDARIAVAAEPELLVAVTHLVADTGARIVAAVSPTHDPLLASAACDEVVVGDLADLRARAAEAGAEVVLGSSHAVDAAAAAGASLLPLGLPVDHRFGAQLGGAAGYRGGLRLLFDLANQVLTHRDGDHRGAAPTTRSQPC